MNNEYNFKLIQGGLFDAPSREDLSFVSAYATNTRLMGVIGMHIRWEGKEGKVLYQFFHFDAEEFGFDDYKSFKSEEPAEHIAAENSLIGGLGGNKVSLSEKEALYLFQSYVSFNASHKLPLPEGASECEFLTEPKISLSEPDAYILNKKLCASISNNYEAINYFLMRYFAKDEEGVSFIYDGDIDMNMLPDISAATFYKNDTSPGTRAGLYHSRSLIESGSGYYLITSQLETKGHYVSDFKIKDYMKVSEAEAAMQLNRSEFVSVFDVGNNYFQKGATNLSLASMVIEHNSGYMFMIFHKDNAHVANSHYRLDDDVLGTYYFVPHSHQLIAASRNYEGIRILERDLRTSKYMNELTPLSKYEFLEPVLLDFIESEMEDFEDFIDIIKNN